MALLHEVTMEEVVSDLPPPNRLAEEELREFDVWICALGFEERCYAMAQTLVKGGSQAKQVFVCFYETNQEDNDRNREWLAKCLHGLGAELTWCGADDRGLTDALRHHISGLRRKKGKPLCVGWDISVASNQLAMKVGSALLDSDCEVEVMYAEAETYYPTSDEYAADPGRWSGENRMGLDRGTLNVRASSEYPGEHSNQLANRLIIIPGYNRDRVRRVISNVDQQFLVDFPGAPITWLIGAPHLEEHAWRRDAVMEIHGVPVAHDTREVSTFDYTDTLIELERAYGRYGLSHNITLAPMGSKLQALACSMFCVARPDVRVMFAQPEEYNADRYTAGIRDKWSLPLGNAAELRSRLRSIGTLYKPS